MTAPTILSPRLTRPSNRLTQSIDDRKAWVASLLHSDTFQGVVEDPQSLHKYLYVHGDPVNGVDPSGEYRIGSLLGAIAIGAYIGYEATGSAVGAAGGGAFGALLAVNPGVAIAPFLGGGIIEYSLLISLTISPHPPDAGLAAYQNRMNKASAVLSRSIDVGNAFIAGGLPAVEGLLNTNNLGPGMDPFPAQGWNQLADHGGYVIGRYSQIAGGDVMVSKLIEPFATGWHQITAPGIIVSHKRFWNDDIRYPIDTLLHEAVHDFVLGHNCNHPLMGLAQVDGCGDGTWFAFVDWAQGVRSANNGMSVWQLIVEAENSDQATLNAERPRA